MKLQKSASISLKQLFEAIWLEGAFEIFRRQRGIGPGTANREKFTRVLPRAMADVMARN